MEKIASPSLPPVARPRRTPRFLNRPLLDALESRLLLSSTLLPITNHYGLIYDPTRNQLDIPGDNGLLYRYDVANKTMLSPITVGGNLGPGDITPDGAYLYLTDRDEHIIHKVNLTTGITTDLPFSFPGDGEHASDLKIISGNEAILTTHSNPISKYPIITLNLTNDTFDDATVPGLPSTLSPDAPLFRSADYSVLFIGDETALSDSSFIYNAVTQTSSELSLGEGGVAAISPDGSLIAALNGSSVSVFNQQFQTLAANLPFGSVEFNPDGSTLYDIQFDGTITSYDTTTFSKKATFTIGQSAEISNSLPMMQISSDGKTLFVTTDTDVRAVDVDPSAALPPPAPQIDLSETVAATITHPPAFWLALAGINSVLPSGTVEILDGSTVVASLISPGGHVGLYTPTITLSSPLSPGAHTITAVYLGDDTYAPATSAPLSITVQVLPTTTSLVVTDPLHEIGAPVTLTATVTSATNTSPSGTVLFYDGSTLIGTVASSTNSTASFSTSSLAVGPHSFSAVYTGTTDYTKSTSSQVTDRLIAATVIDLLVLYTPAAATVTDIDSTVQQAVAQTNLAMLNSDIPVVIHVVDQHPIDYTESGNYTTDLSRLANPSDGFMDTAAALRQEYHADLVSLFVGDEDTADQYIGLGSELNNPAGDPTQAYTVVDAADADQFVLAHEIGHNLGARHDTDNDTPGGFQTAHGYRFTGDDQILYHDIMSYAPGTTIPYYSNPNITYAGAPEGTADADAAATMIQMAPIVANYSNLLSVSPVAPQGDISSISNTTITGWGYDANADASAARVRLDIDGVTGTPFLASLATPDVSATVGSIDHGFSFTLPAALANGTHTVTLFVQDAPGNTFVQLAQQSFTLTKLPDLTLSVGSINKPLGSYLPGDALSFPVTITNNGTLAAPAHTVVDVRLSTDSTYEDADPLLFQFTLPTTLAAGASKTFTVKAKLPTDLAAAAYGVVASVDPANTIAESDETNNTAAGNQSLNVLWQFGALPGRPGNHALTFHDADGTAVTLHLTGPGTGTLTHDSAGYRISLANTTAKSALAITTAKSKTPGDDARFTLDSLSDATPLHSLTARTTDLQSNLTLAASPASLTLGNILGPSTITLGAGAVANLTFATIQTLTLTDASPIRTFRATQWLSLNDADNSLAAPSINNFLIAGKRESPLAG